MNEPSACQHRTLSRNHVACVQQCTDCGCVAVHVGPVSLRLDASSYEALVVALVDAAGSLDGERAARSVRAHRGAA